MESRGRWNPGIAEVTMQAYANHHAGQGNGSCWRPKIKSIVLTIVCMIILSLAVYWLIVGPIFESQRLAKTDKNERRCDR